MQSTHSYQAANTEKDFFALDRSNEIPFVEVDINKIATQGGIGNGLVSNSNNST